MVTELWNNGDHFVTTDEILEEMVCTIADAWVDELNFEAPDPNKIEHMFALERILKQFENDGLTQQIRSEILQEMFPNAK